MINNFALQDYLNQLLDPNQMKDYSPNGLQVQGTAEINKIITGVTASQELIDYAIAQQADALIVHHGYFWPGESAVLTGYKYQRIKKLINHNINLYAYHLPLDKHPLLGNNAQLCKLLGLQEVTINPHNDLLFQGTLKTTPAQLQIVLEQLLNRSIVYVGHDPQQAIEQIAICSGGAQGMIDQAFAAGAQLFMSGEISEQTTHSALEQGKHYFALGHHASEVWGVAALADYLKQQLQLDVDFKDIYNPA